MTLKVTHTLLLIGILILFCKAKSTGHLQRFSKTYLGITLMPHYSQKLITYGVVTVKDSVVTRHDVITEKNFILIASGEMKSDCNPLLLNKFEHHNIPLCSLEYAPEFRRYSFDCPLLKNVWRVRYDKHPDFLNEDTEQDSDEDASVLDNVPDSLKGWASNKIHPSDGQMQILKRYGITTISDVIYGDSLWLFLKDISNPIWVENYRAN